MIDVERLLILRAVARHGSKAAAARALGVAEPTVAHHLRALARSANVPLTVRAGRVTQLTPAGQALLEHADAIAVSLDNAERALHQHAELSVGRLQIAAFTSFASMELPAPLALFARTYPGVEIGLVEAETDDALALLRSGAADLVIGFADTATPPPSGLPLTWLKHDEYFTVLPEAHAEARGPYADMAALSGDRWISGCNRCQNHLNAQAAEAGFTPEIAFVTEDYVTAQHLVANYLGVALLPRMAIDASPPVPGIVTLPSNPATYREIFVTAGNDPAPAALAFAAMLTGPGISTGASASVGADR